MKIWHAVGLALGAAAVVVVALVLTGVGNGLALLAYVLFIAAVLSALLVGRLRRALPPAPDFDRLIGRPEEADQPVEQLETFKRLVTLAGSTRADLFRLRPPVREIVTARLSRRWGVDLEREPERVRALLGDGLVWELVRPDPVAAADVRAPGWTQRELERLVEELEGL